MKTISSNDYIFVSFLCGYITMPWGDQIGLGQAVRRVMEYHNIKNKFGSIHPDLEREGYTGVKVTDTGFIFLRSNQCWLFIVRNKTELIANILFQFWVKRILLRKKRKLLMIRIFWGRRGSWVWWRILRWRFWSQPLLQLPITWVSLHLRHFNQQLGLSFVMS